LSKMSKQTCHRIYNCQNRLKIRSKIVQNVKIDPR
jgi:hypothetical protein